MLSPAAAKSALIRVLQLAYSGELAAANAYRGHWQSVRDQGERQQILKIEIQELEHRHAVGELLSQLKARPSRWQDFKMNLIGRTIALLCRFGGWFVPMYGAGRLESNNVDEYLNAARYAWLAMHHEMIPCLLEMAELEWDHEAYFRQKIAGHPLQRYFPAWKSLPPKAELRSSFARFCQQAQRQQLQDQISHLKTTAPEKPSIGPQALTQGNESP